MDIRDANNIARALRIVAMTPRGEALIDDLNERLSAERDKQFLSAKWLDDMTLMKTVEHDDGTKERIAVTRRVAISGKAENAMSPILRETVDMVTARVIRDQGFKVPTYGQPITDAIVLELLIKSGHAVETETAEMIFTEDTETLKRSATGDLLTDKPSRVKPFTRGITDSGFTDSKARTIDSPILGRLFRRSDGSATDDIWCGIGSVMEQGFFFEDRKGKEIRIPALAAMVSKAINRFGGRGKALRQDLIDDVASASMMRAYLTMTAVIAMAGYENLVTYHSEELETSVIIDAAGNRTVAPAASAIDVHCPMREIAGVFETRNIRCGECAPCRAGYSPRQTLQGEHESWEEEMSAAIKASTTDIKSRYSNGNCLAPKPKTEYVDIQRILQRSAYGEAQAATSYERDDEKKWATAEEIERHENSVIADATAFVLECGHKNCEARECLIFKLVHAAAIITENLGHGVIGKNGAVSGEFLDMVARIAFPYDIQQSTAYLRRKARALIVEVLSGERGREAAVSFSDEAERRAVVDARAQREALGQERLSQARRQVADAERVPEGHLSA